MEEGIGSLYSILCPGYLTIVRAFLKLSISLKIKIRGYKNETK